MAILCTISGSQAAIPETNAMVLHYMNLIC